MPYKKPTTPFLSMTRLLKSYDLAATGLSKVLGNSPKTARGKLNDPSRLTLADLSNIHKYGHISWEEIRTAIKE